MDRGIGDADRAYQPELGLHEEILENIFGDRRQRPVEPEYAAVAHRVELKIAEADPLHFAVGRMVLDPIFVPAVAVARMEPGRMLVGDRRELVEPPAGQPAQALEMRLEMIPQRRLDIEVEQLFEPR